MTQLTEGLRGAAAICATVVLTSFIALAATTAKSVAAELDVQRGLLEITGTKSAYLTQFLVSGSDFLSIHGLTFDAQDNLYVGSVMGQAIHAIDIDLGESSVFVGPPEGMADDLEFGPDGTVVWTSILAGTVHGRLPNGEIIVIAKDLPGVNAVAFHPDGRLFVTQVLWGDALWELDISGKRPPRKVLSDLGHLNGFDFDRDGYLYGPLMFKGVVARIDVDSGEIKTLSSGFSIPVAVNLDGDDNIYVVDGRLGRLIRLDKDTGDQTLLATLDSGIDNLAINSKNEVFVTNLADNAIHKINSRTGSYRTIMRSTLSVPGGLDVATDNNVDTIYVGDLFNFSSVNGASGKVKKIKRGLRDHFQLAMAVTVQGNKVVTSSWFADAVEIFDRQTGNSLASYLDLNDPVDAILLDDGRVLVAEQGSGNLVAIDSKNDKVREILVSGISGMAALYPLSKEEVYLSKIDEGQLLRINIESGKQSVVVDGLYQPEGFDIAPDGTIVLAEVGKKRVIRIDPKTGAVSEVARNLAIGYPAANGSPEVFITTGVGVSDSGTIYVSSDVNTAIYKITPE